MRPIPESALHVFLAVAVALAVAAAVACALFLVGVVSVGSESFEGPAC